MIYHPRAGVVELVDARVSNTRSFGIVGSIPTTRTNVLTGLGTGAIFHGIFHGLTKFRRKAVQSCAKGSRL